VRICGASSCGGIHVQREACPRGNRSPVGAILKPIPLGHDAAMDGRSGNVDAGAVTSRPSARAEARRLAWIASFFVWAGWFLVAYAAIAGLLWWLDLTSLRNVTILEALGLSLDVVAGPLFLALIVAGLGHCARLFALYVADHAEG
jgi:hypothetical protein